MLQIKIALFWSSLADESRERAAASYLRELHPLVDVECADMVTSMGLGPLSPCRTWASGPAVIGEHGVGART